MAEEKKTEVEKLNDRIKEKRKNYKTPFDVDRVDHLVSASRLLKDYLNYGHITGAILNELTGIELRQEEIDAKEQAEYDKELAEAQAKDAKAAKAEAEKEGHSSPPRGRAA